VIHERDVFVFEDLLPVCFFVEFFYGEVLAGLGVFGFEEGEPFGLYYALEHTVLLHLF
jgi:hypothetical protein